MSEETKTFFAGILTGIAVGIVADLVTYPSVILMYLDRWIHAWLH